MIKYMCTKVHNPEIQLSWVNKNFLKNGYFENFLKDVFFEQRNNLCNHVNWIEKLFILRRQSLLPSFERKWISSKKKNKQKWLMFWLMFANQTLSLFCSHPSLSILLPFLPLLSLLLNPLSPPLYLPPLLPSLPISPLSLSLPLSFALLFLFLSFVLSPLLRHNP